MGDATEGAGPVGGTTDGWVIAAPPRLPAVVDAAVVGWSGGELGGDESPAHDAIRTERARPVAAARMP